MVLAVEIRQPKGTGDVGQEPEEDEDTARLSALARHVVVEEDADEDAEGDEDAVGDLEERGAERAEAEALQD